jgi:hypothetical protein
MNEVAFNACYGGFSLSRAAVLLGRELSGDNKWGGACIKEDVYADGSRVDRDYGFVDLPRHDPILVAVIRKLSGDASAVCADIQIATIDGDRYRINEYDGNESVETPESIDWVVIQ